ncbi:hypothetical protein A8B83_19560 [Rhodobacteraceae bacterium EhC02]|nr:hypothetical protein A8B83_19560 [Rhodobacteraceae bacterium EhC02]
MTQPLLDHRITGRNRRTALALAGVWIILVLLLVVLDAAGWIVAGLALFTLPALWDLLSDRASGLRLTRQDLHWFSGAKADTIPLARIKAVRLDRRLDLSYRVSVVLHDMRRIRLPQDCVPPIPVLQDALTHAALPVERHLFSLL